MLVDHGHPYLSVRRQCGILELNRSSLYYMPKPDVPNDEQLELMRLTDEIYTKYPFFGTRQMSSYITLHHQPVRRHQIRWVYERLGLQSTAPGPHTSKPHPEHKIYPYLLNDVQITRPFQVWSTDITYLRLQRGFAYLVAIIDWYSRFVLDWQISISLEADFCVETLARVLANSRCVIFNTDQGSQFTSSGFTGLLAKYGIQISQEWESVTAVRGALKDYFQFYNYKRPHQGLAGLTPAMVHKDGVLH